MRSNAVVRVEPLRDQLHHEALELRLWCIRDFLSVAESGSIAQASASIFKAASAITRAISQLEDCLGVALFERKSRGMLLNSYGEAARDRARRIAEEVAAAIDENSRPGKRHSAVERNALGTLLLNGRSLLLLISLSDLRNVSAAAAQIGLSQSGASMALSRIEGALGERLFHRMMQGMIPTDAGAKIVSRAKRIFAELRHMRSDIAAIAGTTQGSVIIGALPLVRTDVLPNAIASALRRHPKIRVKTVESPYEVLVSGLRDGTVDFIVGALRSEQKTVGLAAERLFEDRLSIVVRAGHPLVRGKPSVEELLLQHWILPRPNAPARTMIDLSFRELGIHPPVPSVETGDLAILRGLLRHSDMVTAISPHQLLYEIASGDFVVLPIALDKTARQIGITSRAEAVLSPAAEAIIQEIRASSRSLTAS